ncbi:MAG: DUF2244 domain-containing protein [Burkholderiales bacterium]|nr:DUF2244 domain-containing protein [Burkholderiales bacterium]
MVGTVIAHPVFGPILEQEGAGFTYFRRHAGSFELRTFTLVFGSLALLSLVIAGGFAAAGAWLIVPFAGLEIAALLTAAAVFLRRAGDFERVAVLGDRVVVEFRERGLAEKFEFHRGWARVVTGKSGMPALRSHGRTVEIGRYCGDEGRQMLARALHSRLGGHRT